VKTTSSRAFTMIELLTTLVIVAIIALIVTPFVGDYVSRARLTAARHTVAVLNEALNEYKTLGGIDAGYALYGSTGSTVNSATLTSAAISALETGFTKYSQKMTFVKETEVLNASYIGSTGSGKTFSFVVDETTASSGTTTTSTTPTLTVASASATYDSDTSVNVTVTASTSNLSGRTVTLTCNGSSYTGTLSSTTATIAVATSSLTPGSYTMTASTSAYTVGSTSYAAASGSGTLTVACANGVGYMVCNKETSTTSATTSTGYIALKYNGKVSIKATTSSSIIPSSSDWVSDNISCTFWSCAGSADSTASGDITALVLRDGVTVIDVSQCKALTSLRCSHIGSDGLTNGFTSINASGCTALETLDCSGLITQTSPAGYTTLNVKGCTALKTLSCHSNALTSLDVRGCTALTSLSCGLNSLTSLDVSSCTALTTLNCYSNSLTSLDVSACTKLTYLSCYSNTLTSLDVSANTKLTYLYCYGNTALVGTATALQTLYNSLPTFSSGTHSIYIGTAAATDTTYDSIATAKKWTIYRTGS
jgi:prepilin-type N-terminal cleavage/methylation domain-containing protein